MATMSTGMAVAVAAPAAAAPVYEIDGRWADGTPTEVSSGDVINAEWRINVNDDAEAPSNDPVDDVTATITVQNGEIASMPDLCLTTGVTPASSISADGTTLTCNLGTVDMGTAVAIEVPVVASGVTGDQITMTGEVGGVQAQPLPPVDIVNAFGMDMEWGTPTANVDYGNGYVDVDMQWTLFLDSFSEPGPDSVSYTLTLAASNGSLITDAPAGCEPYTTGGPAPGHPWSGGTNDPDQTAPFVGTCTLTPTGTPGEFTLTLTGIDYSLAQVPTEDSAGVPLRTDADAVASGQVTFRVATTTSTGVRLNADAPTYVAPGTGAVDVDDATNNRSSKSIVFGGAYSSAFQRFATGSGGTAWDDSYRLSPGSRAVQAVSMESAGITGDPDDLYGLCNVLDTKYVTLTTATLYGIGNQAQYPVQYYVGTDPTVDPASASYDPDAFDCGLGGTAVGGSGDWVSTPPADLSTVRAVRAVYPLDVALASTNREAIESIIEIRDDAPAGQDVWQWGQVLMGDGTWIDTARDVTPTPDARYPETNTLRDILRIVSATPNVQKSADRAVVVPGTPATFTLLYSANGGGGTAGTVDNYELVDVLPVGMTYVPSSATPAPTITTDSAGRQVLTWTIDDVPVNTQVPLTYEAVADASVPPGTVLTNEVTATLDGNTATSHADVTLSTNGYTQIGKTATQWFISNPDGDGSGETGTWTVSLRSFDPLPQQFTDTIDILPYNGDNRGTSYTGTYDVTDVDVPAGATVYYTDVAPSQLSDDPEHTSNGAAGTIAGNTVNWSTTAPADPTAIRVIGGELPPGGTFEFDVTIEPDGADPGDVWVNRAQARAEHTELVMRTSEPLTMGTEYSASLIKEVQDLEGNWHNANDVSDYPVFRDGDTVKYRITVTNTGQGTLENVVVTDDQEPTLGAFTITSLAPGASESHEFEITADAAAGEMLVNTACATSDQPDDSEDPVQINCDPAGFEIDGEPTHTKSLVSATPIGGGQWEVVYGLEVTNTSAASTSYTLDDELHFTDQVTVTSAAVTSAPNGVTLETPAWDGDANTRIATGVPLLGDDDAGYALHTYELTVIADVPLQLAGAGGSPDPTQCGADGDDSDTAFNNTSALTDESGAVEEDQACAGPPSIGIDKTVSDGPVPNGDGTWTVTYDIVATNSGSADGEYEVTDQMTVGGDLVVDSAAVITSPSGVTPAPGWTGMGADGDAENVIATGVTLPAGDSHTYQVEVVLNVDDSSGAPIVTECDALGGGDQGGLTNAAGIEHNDLTDEAEACVTVGYVTVDKTISDGPVTNGDGTWTITYDLVVENTGAATAAYDISDRLRYGAGIDVTSATVTKAPEAATVSESWTGLGDEGAESTIIASDVELEAAGSHTYRVEVVATIDAAATDASTFTCPEPGSGEPGGFANVAGIGHNGLTDTAEACAEPTPQEGSTSPSAGDDPGAVVTPVGSLPRTGATVAGILALAVLLTLAGAYGVRTARRRTAA